MEFTLSKDVFHGEHEIVVAKDLSISSGGNFAINADGTCEINANEFILSPETITSGDISWTVDSFLLTATSASDFKIASTGYFKIECDDSFRVISKDNGILAYSNNFSSWSTYVQVNSSGVQIQAGGGDDIFLGVSGNGLIARSNTIERWVNVAAHEFNMPDSTLPVTVDLSQARLVSYFLNDDTIIRAFAGVQFPNGVTLNQMQLLFYVDDGFAEIKAELWAVDVTDGSANMIGSVLKDVNIPAEVDVYTNVSNSITDTVVDNESYYYVLRFVCERGTVGDLDIDFYAVRIRYETTSVGEL